MKKLQALLLKVEYWNRHLMKFSLKEKIIKSRENMDEYTKAKYSTSQEWIKSYIVTFCIIATTLCGCFPDLISYFSKYYGLNIFGYTPKHQFLLISITIFSYIFFIGRLFFQKKINKGIINLTWDLVIGMILFLIFQAYMLVK